MAQDSIKSAIPKETSRSRTLIRGQVTDAVSGVPLAGASVYVTGLKQGAITDQKGNYLLSDLPRGEHLLEVSFVGYATLVETIILQDSLIKNFSLRTTVAENEGITITGVSTATQVKKTPVPVNLVKRETLLRNTSTNLIDALTRVPGVSQVSTGPAISKPSIRGLGYNRVVVVNDGVRQEGQQWGDEHGIEIDELGVAKAEVMKGPASIIYGSDALAGVVNIISVIPAPQGVVRGNILANYQTNNHLRGFHANLDGNGNGFIWGLGGTYKAASDYRNPYDGWVFNSKFNEKDVNAYAGINRRWGFTHLLFSRFDQNVGLVEGERDDITGQFLKLIDENGLEESVPAENGDFKSIHPFIPKQRIQHTKITSDNSFDLGSDRMTLTLGYQRNQRQEYGNILDPGEKELYFDLHSLNYNLQYHLSGKNGWKTSLGINGMYQKNTNLGIDQLIPDFNLMDIGGFLFSRKSFDKLTLSGGVRMDNRHIDTRELIQNNVVKFEALRKNFTNLSATAGISYELSDQVVLKFNLARGFRAPSIPELSSNGAHEGTNRYEYGEPDLKSEFSLQTDGDVEIHTEHLTLDFKLFYNHVQNFIFYRKLSSAGGGDSLIVDGGQTWYAFRFDQQDANLYGGEFQFDIHPHPLDWLHFENSFSYVRGLLSEERDGSRNLPFIPAPRLVNELRGDFLKQGKTVRNFYIKIELDNTFSQEHPFTGYNTETDTPGYSLVNLGLGGDIQSRGRTIFSLYFGALNLTDKAYQNHLSRLKYTPVNPVTGRTGVFNMGRNFSIKINVPLQFSSNS